MASQRAASIALDPDSVEELNSVLEGSDLASCVVDPVSKLAVIALNVFSILPEGGRLEEEYPLCLAVHPVGRVAASHVVGGSVQPLDLADIDQVLNRFSYRTIDDWDLIDPPENLRFKWSDAISLDRRWSDSQGHLLELWQDDAPLQLLNIGLWFDHMYLFDVGLRPVTMDMLTRWRKRLKSAMDAAVGPEKGWSRASPAEAPPVLVSSVLERIEGA